MRWPAERSNCLLAPTLSHAPPAHQAAGSHKMPNRHTARTNRRARAHQSTRSRARIDAPACTNRRAGVHESTHRRARTDTGRGRIGPPGRDGGTGSRESRASQFARHHGNLPLENTTLRTGANGHLIASADMPPTMPIPETETQKKVRWPTSMREPTPLGALGGLVVVRKKVRRITSARGNSGQSHPAITRQ